MPPFARLARTHGVAVAGDALVSISLAGTLFFDLDPNDARWRVALYLLLTMAPFAVVAPWLGPLMDQVKGGHRYMMMGSAAMRALVALAMARYVDSFVLFPLAFTMLVLGKTHHITKSALVPTTVPDPEQLVLANSRLSMISALAAAVAGIPGVILLKLGGAPAALILASVVFFVASLTAFRIPPTKVADAPVDLEERAELRGAGIILAASAMGYIRAMAGFLTMLLAFELRTYDPGPTGAGVEIGHRVRESLGFEKLDLTSGGAPAWHFGVVLAAMGIGGFAGAIASPRIRKMVSEERIIQAALIGTTVFGLLAAISGGLIGAVIVAMAVSLAGQIGKQSFDSIVQRDAPKANLGRSFSKFESRFQLFWVIGALLPVVVPLPARLGFLLLAGLSAFAAVSFWFGKSAGPSIRRVAGKGRSTSKTRRRPKETQDASH